MCRLVCLGCRRAEKLWKARNSGRVSGRMGARIAGQGTRGLGSRPSAEETKSADQSMDHGLIQGLGACQGTAAEPATAGPSACPKVLKPAPCAAET